MRPRRAPEKRARTVEERKTALLQMLVYRPSLDNVKPEDLSRSFGLSEPMTRAMLEGERLRRSARG